MFATNGENDGANFTNSNPTNKITIFNFAELNPFFDKNREISLSWWKLYDFKNLL